MKRELSVPEKHQLKIARDTLKMTPAGARIMGGMSFERAYEIVYKCTLRARLTHLITTYGEGPLYSWELESRGWTPKALLDCLNA